MPALTTPGVDPSEVDAVYVSLSPEGQEAVVGRFTNQQRIVKVRDGDADRAKAIRDKLAEFPPGEAPDHLVDLEAALPPETREQPVAEPPADKEHPVAEPKPAAAPEPDKEPKPVDPDSAAANIALATELAKKPIKDLRALAVERGLDDSGDKHELAARLVNDGYKP